MRISRKTGLWLIPFIALIVSGGSANTAKTRLPPPDIYARYPYRLPDWFWQSPQNAFLLTPEEVIAAKNDIAKLNALSNPSARRALEAGIAEGLAAKFSVRDLIVSSTVVTSPKNGVSLAVLIDPSFGPSIKAVLEDAALRFIEVAFDPEVIKKAFERSTQTPSPMPAVYESKHGEPVVDGAGRPVFSENYAFYLRQRTKPASVDAFLMQLRNALMTATGDPAVLMISRYSGDAWWGGGYNSFHAMPQQQLKREIPACGYLYIRLNADKLTQPEPGWDDINFWASKIAHESLHNLGYWHPNYQDPGERDANNRENEWAFIVSYEFAILEKLQEAVI